MPTKRNRNRNRGFIPRKLTPSQTMAQVHPEKGTSLDYSGF
jgi:hypothetical protein